MPSHRRRLIWHATRGQPRGVGETIADRFPAETHRFLPYAGEDFLPEIQSGQPLVLRKPQHRWSRDLANLTNEFAV